MKRYCVIPSIELASDSDSLWESILIDGKVGSSDVYDRELQGVCLHHLNSGINISTDRVLYNVFELIKQAYPCAVIPISPKIYEKKLGSYAINPTTNLLQMPVYATNLTSYIGSVVRGACSKYYGDLTRLYITYVALSQNFRAKPVDSMKSGVDLFLGLVYDKGRETKTYGVKELREKVQEINDYTEIHGDSTNKTANTPEIVQNESLDSVLADFISALSKVDSNSDNAFNRVDEQTNEFNKTGTITTDKEHEHNFIEVLNSLKADLFSILDKIVNEFAITFVGVC